MKKKKDENYLEFLPIKKENLKWDTDDSGIVTIYIENKGIFKWITQKLLGKPKISQIHLEIYGSFIWQQIDGKRRIMEIADLAENEFGEKIHPLYERISSYFNMLERADLISMEKND
ncbi:MAG: PqqD family protein [Roseburia sp.]|nr:PqqD family protein [Roseburia sp.]